MTYDPSIKEPEEIIASAIEAHMRGRSRWVGTATELLESLDLLVDTATRLHPGWPQGFTAVGKRLRQARQEILRKGVVIGFFRCNKRRPIILETI